MTTVGDSLNAASEETYTINGLHARTIITMLAPDWALLRIQLATYDVCAHHPAYAGVYQNSKAWRDHQMQVAMLADIEAVLAQLTDQRPDVETKHFIRFQKDHETHMLAPMYDKHRALDYRQVLIDAWTGVALKGQTIQLDTGQQ